MHPMADAATLRILIAEDNRDSAGTLAKPRLTVDTGTVAARGLGALLLGFVNPLLAVVPLIETGPGRDSDCGRLIQEAKAPPKPQPRASS